MDTVIVSDRALKDGKFYGYRYTDSLVCITKPTELLQPFSGDICKQLSLIT